MERLYRGFDIITNRVHTSNQQRQKARTKNNSAIAGNVTIRRTDSKITAKF
ncbi:hypothetical protein BDGGKGIB_01220 [Nodularia sphaerocarpa UHCC 0038]|nr:hypothetical protein BDGGKGIB_01220 [Nodularia sphaerocarpa UHCC 0038]